MSPERPNLYFGYVAMVFGPAALSRVIVAHRLYALPRTEAMSMGLGVQATAMASFPNWDSAIHQCPGRHYRFFGLGVSVAKRTWSMERADGRVVSSYRASTLGVITRHDFQSGTEQSQSLIR
jgi:hypothetical protein